MEKDEEFGSGVVSVFDAIASERKEKPAAAQRPAKSHHERSAAGKGKDRVRSEARAERPKARPGRFPGSKNGPPKEKITGRIAPELKDAYVDWALEDRCPLSDLMERALTEFYQRHRATSRKTE